MKVFLAKFGGVASFGTAKVSNLQKFSPQKLYFSPIHKVFFLESFPLFGIPILNKTYRLFNSYMLYGNNLHKIE